LAQKAESLYVVGRGPALPIAAETALKLKETCAIHAEAYSIAEVMHGPLELLGEGYPVLAYSPDDQSRASSQEALAKLRKTGAHVLVAEAGGLAFQPSLHPLLDPIPSYKPPIASLRPRRRRADATLTGHACSRRSPKQFEPRSASQLSGLWGLSRAFARHQAKAQVNLALLRPVAGATDNLEDNFRRAMGHLVACVAIELREG